MSSPNPAPLEALFGEDLPFGVLRRWLRHHRDMQPARGHPDWELFEKQLAERTFETAQVMIVVGAALLLLFWPTDFLLLDDAEQVRVAFLRYRAGTLLLLGLFFFALRHSPSARRQPAWLCLPFGVVGVGWMSYALGGTGQPIWYYCLHLVLFIPMAFPGRFGLRLISLISLAASLVAGYLLAHPENLEQIRLSDALLFLATALCFSQIAGHGWHLAFVRELFLQRQTEASAGALRELNDTLDRRVADQTADLRALGEHLQAVREQERARISRELHDDLGQRMAATRYALGGARRSLSRGVLTGLPESLEKVDELLGDAASTVRRIVGALHPPLLEELGLRGACEWLCREVEEREAFTLTLTVEGPVEGADEPREACSLVVYRILQEALTNVARHAEATAVEVELTLAPGVVKLTVQDDGRGFGPAPLERPTEGGFGLLGMKERAHAVGGRARIESAEGKGTRVTLRIPARAPGERE